MAIDQSNYPMTQLPDYPIQYRRYFARMRRHLASSALHDEAIDVGSSPARTFASVAVDPNSVAAASSLNSAACIFASADAISSPTRTGRSRSRSVTSINSPRHIQTPIMSPYYGMELSG